MGWGTIPDDHALMAGMVGLQTSHRYGNATMLAVRLRPRHRQPLGQPPHRLGRGLHQGPHVRPRRHRADADRPRVRARTSASSRTRRRRSSCSSRSPREWKAAGKLRDRIGLGRECQAAQAARCCARRHFDARADQAAARLRGDEQGVRPRHLLRHHDRPVADRRRAVPARLQAAPLDQLRPGRAARAGRCRPRSACAPPTRTARSWRCPATTTSSS